MSFLSAIPYQGNCSARVQKLSLLYRMKHKGVKIFSDRGELAARLFCYVMSIPIVAFGPILGVIAAGLIYGGCLPHVKKEATWQSAWSGQLRSAKKFGHRAIQSCICTWERGVFVHRSFESAQFWCIRLSHCSWQIVPSLRRFDPSMVAWHASPACQLTPIS